MYSLNAIFTGFSLTMYIIIIVYFYSALKERTDVEYIEAKTWLLKGIAYSIMLVFMAFGLDFHNNVFLAFLLVSLYVSMVIVQRNMEEYLRLSHFVLNFIMVFNVAWMLYSYVEGFRFLYIILPSVLMQCALYFFIGLMYLLYDEYEMSMRNVSGMFFLMLTIVKLFYLTKINVEHNHYIYSIFRIEFLVYILLAFILVLFDYNKGVMANTGKNKKFIEAFNHTSVGIIQVNSRGDILTMNSTVEYMLGQMKLSFLIDTLFNVRDILSFDKDYWNEIIKDLSEGNVHKYRESLQVESKKRSFEFMFLPNMNLDGDNRHVTTFSCFIFLDQQ